MTGFNPSIECREYMGIFGEIVSGNLSEAYCREIR